MHELVEIENKFIWRLNESVDKKGARANLILQLAGRQLMIYEVEDF